MTVIQLIFYVLSTVAIGSAMLVVGSGNPVRGALFLVLTFFSAAGLWILMRAEFLGLILILVYVGAVMTLFLFVVMMLSVSRLNFKEGFVRYLPFALLMVGLVVGMSIMVIGARRYGLANLPAPAEPANYNNMVSLGKLLYTQYAYPFEIAAVMLLTGIVAAISLTHRPGKAHKSQRASAQIAVKATDRLRLVDIESGPRQQPVTQETGP